MAYGLKYYAQQNDDDGNVVRVEILEEDWVGGSSSYRFLEDGVEVEKQGPGRRDVYQTIHKKKASVTLLDANATIEDDLATAKHTEYVCLIYRGGITTNDIFFAGYITPLTSRRSLNFADDAITFTVRDGIEDLRDVPFLDGSDNFYSGLKSLPEILAIVFQKMPYPLAFYIANKWFTPSTPAFHQPSRHYYRSVDDFRDEEGTPVSCYDVLEKLCEAFKLQIVQSGGKWSIIQRDAKFSGTVVDVEQYDNTGAFAFDGVYTIVVSKTEADLTYERFETSRQPQSLGYSKVIVALDHGDVGPVIRNGTFDAEYNRHLNFGGAFTRSARLRSGSLSNDTRLTSFRTYGTGREFGPLRADRTSAVGAFWFDSGGPIVSTDIEVGFAGDEGNSLKLPTAQNTYTLADIPGLPSGFQYVQNDYVQQDGRTIVGDGITQLQVSLACYVNRTVSDFRIIYPTFYRVWLVDSVGTQWYLQRDGTFTSSLNAITLGGLDAQNNYRALRGDSWYFDTILTDAIPVGTWELKIRLYPSIDPIYSVLGLPSSDFCYWSDVKVDIAINGNVRPSATLVVAEYEDASSRLVRQLSTVWGNVSIVDLESQIVDASGDPLSDFKFGRYTVEPPTGYTLQEICARSMIEEQSEIVKIHEVDFYRGIWVEPHQCLEITTGDHAGRYDAGSVTWKLLRNRMGGSFIRIQSSGVSYTITNVIEEERFTSLGGGFDTATKALIFSDEENFNAWEADKLGQTTAIIDRGLVGTISVSLDAPIEIGDELLIVTNDARFIECVASSNAAVVDTTLDITDDVGATIFFDAAVAFPAYIYPRTTHLRSVLIQTRDALRSSINANSPCVIDGDQSGTVTTINVTPTRFELKTGYKLRIIDDATGSSTTVTLNGDHPQNSTVLNVLSVAIDVADGSPVVLDSLTFQTDIYQNAQNISLLAAGSQTKIGVGTLSRTLTVAGSPYTFLFLSRLEIELKSGDSLTFLNDSSGVETFVVNGPVRRIDFDEFSEIYVPVTSASVSDTVTQPKEVYIEGASFASRLRLEMDRITLQTAKLFGSEIAVLAANVTGVVTSVEVTLCANALKEGDTLVIARTASSDAYQIEVSTDSDVTTLGALQSTLLASSNPHTTLTLSSLAFNLTAADKIYAIDDAGVPTEFTCQNNETASGSPVVIEISPGVNLTNDITAGRIFHNKRTVSIESATVEGSKYEAIRAGAVAAMRLALDGISFEGPLFTFGPFNGVLDANKELTSRGDPGTGLTITKAGALYAAGGTVQLDDDGLTINVQNVWGGPSPSQQLITFKSDSGNERLVFAADNNDGEITARTLGIVTQEIIVGPLGQLGTINLNWNDVDFQIVADDGAGGGGAADLLVKSVGGVATIAVEGNSSSAITINSSPVRTTSQDDEIISDQTAITDVDVADELLILDDPSGSPLIKKVTAADLQFTPYRVTIVASATPLSFTPTSTWTALGASVSGGTSGRYAQKADLTKMVQARIIVNVRDEGAAGSRMRVRYATTYAGTYNDLGSSSVEVALSAVGIVDSGWISLVSGAKADIFLKCEVSDAADDANLTKVSSVIVEFRST